MIFKNFKINLFHIFYFYLQVIFEGIVGNLTGDGDMGKNIKIQILNEILKFYIIFKAFDDVSLVNGTCPHLADCDFEDGEICSWNSVLDGTSFEWLVHLSSTSSYGKLSALHLIILKVIHVNLFNY